MIKQHVSTSFSQTNHGVSCDFHRLTVTVLKTSFKKQVHIIMYRNKKKFLNQPFLVEVFKQSSEKYAEVNQYDKSY